MKNLLLLLAIFSFTFVSANNEEDRSLEINKLLTIESVVFEEDAIDDCYVVQLSCYSTYYCPGNSTPKERTEDGIAMEQVCNGK